MTSVFCSNSATHDRQLPQRRKDARVMWSETINGIAVIAIMLLIRGFKDKQSPYKNWIWSQKYELKL